MEGLQIRHPVRRCFHGPGPGVGKNLATVGTFASVCVGESGVTNLMRRKTVISVLLTGCLMAAVAIADDHYVESDKGFDFSKLKTFQLRPGTIDSGRQELNNSLVLGKISDAVRSELTSRGMKETTVQPDIVVDFTAAGLDYNIGPGHVPNVIDASRGHSAGRGARGPDGSGERGPVDFSEGMLMIDVTAKRPPGLIWRGVYRDHEKNSAALGQKFPEDVRKLFVEYPVKRK